MDQETDTSLPMASSPPSQANQGTDFFLGAHNFSIENQYNVGEQTIVMKSGNLGLLDILNPIPDASYTRNRKTSPPDSSCLPGTRQDVLKKVTSWADSSLLGWNNRPVMWLYGYVGCGKSAIAQEVAEHYARKKRLAASFFFFRGSGDRSRTGKFAATIAHQLAGAIPSTSRFIETNVKAHADPIKSVKWDLVGTNILRGPYVIVIDGLDECEDRDEIASFIDQILAFFKTNPWIPLRILITSRVEEHIRTRLDPTQVELVNLVDHTTLDDITTAFRALFAQATKHNCTIQCYGEWPTPSELEKLILHTGCSFIFMSTLAKFILEPSEDGLTPMDRLPLALNIDPGLDGLYGQALSCAEHLPHFLDIIWAIALLQKPLSIQALSALLGIRTFEIVEVLVKLHAILHVPGDDTTPVTLCHSSLHDFLSNQDRSGRYSAPVAYHKRLAYFCMRILGSDNQDSISVIAFRPVQEYAEKHWEYHWLVFCQIVELQGGDARRRETDSLIAHLRVAHSPYFELVFAIYTLMNPELLPPPEAIFPKGIYMMDPEVQCNALVDILQENVPPVFSQAVIKAISILRPRRFHDGDELQAIWGEITPPLPAFSKYCLDLVGICVKNVFVRQPSFVAGCDHFAFNGEKLSTSLVWSLMSLPQHLTLAMQHEPFGVYSWPLNWQGRQDLQDGGNTLFHTMIYLATEESAKEYKEAFIRNVGLAVRAAARLKGLEVYWDSACHWYWNSNDSRPGETNFLFGIQSTNLIENMGLWELVYAFKILADCLGENCSHGTCPIAHYPRLPS